MVRSSLARTALVIAAGLGLVTTACSEDRGATNGGNADVPDTTAAPAVADCAEDLFACAKASMLGDLLPAEPTKASGEPIRLGMINQENTPVGSYPELSSAVKTATTLINEYFGGVGGRPIEVEVCNTQFSPEGSTRCAQQFVEADVPVVIGGIDVFGTGIATLEENGIPFVGGVPVSFPSVQATNSFQFSGGSWGAVLAFARHVIESGAERVAVAYPEFDASVDGAERAEKVLRAAGLHDVQMIPYPITATDLTAPIQAAKAADPDALIMLAADMGCAGTFEGVATVGIEAQVYVVGACAAPNITRAAGPERTEGVIFNVEQQLADPDDVDFALYSAAVERWGDFEPVGAGTVAFRSMINLWTVMVGLEEITAETVTAALRSTVNAPSFLGHPFTCDGSAMPDFPAMCAPQQVLVQMRSGELEQITDWIDPAEVVGVDG